MGIYSFLNRSAKKDERITELEAQVARLTDQNTKIAEANQETERILADQDVFIAALKADKMRLEQEAGECFETITDLRARLDMAHAVETSQAEVIATQKQGIVDLEAALVTSFGHIDELKQDVAAQVERITELEHDAAEHAVASQRYVKDIAELQGECLAIASENSDRIMFVRKCATGANIRADKPGGAKLVADARALLKQYDSVKEQIQ